LAREIVVEVPDEDIGGIAMHNIIPRLSDTPGRLRLPAPRLGEHTAEILGQFGIDRSTLEALARDGVIGIGNISS
jgi:crotonobetainyl-CoA:carnitine CoA-transferase CaiB-like acyl-CoA transferase